jgi:hypothetical protein
VGYSRPPGRRRSVTPPDGSAPLIRSVHQDEGIEAGRVHGPVLHRLEPAERCWAAMPEPTNHCVRSRHPTQTRRVPYPTSAGLSAARTTFNEEVWPKTVVIGGAAPLLHRAKAPGGGTTSRPSVTGVTAGQAWTGTALSSPATARATAACSRSALLRPAECTNCIETRGRTPLTREEDKVGSMAVTRGLDRLRQNC